MTPPGGLSALSAGVDVRTVAGRGGWAGGGNVMLRVYAAYLPRPDRAAAGVLDQLVAPTSRERGAA
jgi:hypothetical protein